ncbi:MAG: hypothetical protein M3R05_05850 [Chloroflexota bacterium]|nr:hypothetical protein [Chloroflexota bacterium]
MLVASAVVLGFVIVALSTPIAGRGDYGQWLMTSRYYLGQDVPGYREVTGLPPVVPVSLAMLRAVVSDPVVSLQLLNALLLVGIGVSFYLLGAVVLGSRAAGAFSVVLGLLVTDRFIELFAFGGLLQAAALMFMALSIASFVRAGAAQELQQRWWLLGSFALALTALSHVGTGMIAVPLGIIVAGVAAFSMRQLGRDVLVRGLLPLAAVLAVVGLYWLLVLLPASGDYVNNPASLAYRGPDRLFSALVSYWPTGVIVALGSVALVLGGVRDLARRQLDGYVVLAAWVAVTWGALLYSVVSGASTDYPRFATLLLAPLVVAAAGGSLWLTIALAAYVREIAPAASQAGWVMVAPAVVALLAAPLAVPRFDRQAQVYQPRDATTLTAAAEWVDRDLGNDRRAVLTQVRDGKWVEGLTGREALFSLPVRYAFRPIEWQRSVDADTLFRATTAMTNGFFFALYTDEAAGLTGADVPTNLLLRVNHGGEFVNLLQATEADSQVVGSRGSISVAALRPSRSAQDINAQQSRISTVWTEAGKPSPISIVRTVGLLRDGATLQLVDESPGNTVRTVLRPPPGMAITSFDAKGREARVCFTQIGESEPCVRIWVAPADATIQPTGDGGLAAATAQSSRLEIDITALTAGNPSVGLRLLDPAELVGEHNVGAAILYSLDPAYDSRVARLGALGFRVAKTFGSYAVLVRDLAVPHGPPL